MKLKPEAGMNQQEAPNFTQSMSMHLNGGEKFSQLNFKIFRDGQPTDIVRITCTSGSPKYLKTVDEFRCGDDTFDVLETRGTGLSEWLDAHSKPAEVKS
jgi:hypothetical protein